MCIYVQQIVRDFPCCQDFWRRGSSAHMHIIIVYVQQIVRDFACCQGFWMRGYSIRACMHQLSGIFLVVRVFEGEVCTHARIQCQYDYAAHALNCQGVWRRVHAHEHKVQHSYNYMHACEGMWLCLQLARARPCIYKELSLLSCHNNYKIYMHASQSHIRNDLWLHKADKWNDNMLGTLF